MNKKSMGKLTMLFAMVSGLATIGNAQSTSQDIKVTVLPAFTVEERVANEMKEKQLRKAAEEKAAADEAAKIAAKDPRTLLSNARTLFISSDTKFFEEVELQHALQKREEIRSWHIGIIDGWANRGNADIFIEIDRPLFTYTFTYEILDQKTGLVLGTGKVTAFDGNEAAPLLAEKIIAEIKKAKAEANPNR
jgi:hypothetical protein